MSITKENPIIPLFPLHCNFWILSVSNSIYPFVLYLFLFTKIIKIKVSWQSSTLQGDIIPFDFSPLI
ncbi:hypothetical protein YC2023_078445 [Brassica napus]